MIHAQVGLAHQAVLQFGDFTFDPNADGHGMVSYFGVQYRQAEQAVLDDRAYLFARLAGLMVDLAQLVFRAVPGAVDGISGFLLQAAQVFGLQGVVLTQSHRHFELGQMHAVIEQLHGTVKTRHNMRHSRAECRLQAGRCAVESSQKLRHGQLQMRANRVFELVAADECDNRGIELFSVVPLTLICLSVKAGQQVCQQFFVTD